MTIKKLDSMPYAQAHIEFDENGNYYLFSYTTLVAGFSGGYLFCNGTYSQTTRKHISAFARELSKKIQFDVNYYDFKRLYENGEVMSVETGEIISIDKI